MVAPPEKILKDLADLAGIEAVFIDNRTDLESFENELRWNEAYFHLASGLRG